MRQALGVFLYTSPGVGDGLGPGVGADDGAGVGATVGAAEREAKKQKLCEWVKRANTQGGAAFKQLQWNTRLDDHEGPDNHDSF